MFDRSPRRGANLQAVAGHRQVLPTHHTARKIINEPKKSHSRSDLVKKLTHRIACRGGDINRGT
jgi:hypothetical protein